MNKKLKFLTQIGPRRNFVLPKSTGYHRLKPLNNCPDNVQFMAQKPDLFNFSKLFTLNLFFEFDSIDSCFNKQHLFKSTLSRKTVEQNYPRGQKFSHKMFNKLQQNKLVFDEVKKQPEVFKNESRTPLGQKNTIFRNLLTFYNYS